MHADTEVAHLTGLRRHIPQLAIEWACDEPDRLWKAIDGTLCFADISGFTALSEKLSKRGRLGGEELVETLSRVFGGMLDSARDRDGTLLKFGGDALLFLFRGKDHALRAASAAVEMRQALRKAREIPTSVGPLKLAMSVGLHSGRIHFFLVGSTHRELVLAGANASMAATVESAARSGEIGVSPATAALLPASAVRPRSDGLLLLNWRKPRSPRVGARPGPDVSERVLRGLFPRTLGAVLARGAPEPEHRVACIAFARFSGTDALLERAGPDVVAAALEATVSAAQQIFETEGITLLAVDIDKDGGKLFLGSGVPRASEDDEGRMLRALRRLANERTALPLQIGVNRGHVFVAEVGTPWRAAYSAMGDTTNTAARICAKASPREIYAHPAVLAHARTKYRTTEVGPFELKGKTTPQIVCRVGEENVAVTDDRADALPLVGRRRELAVLASTVDALQDNIGNVVSITGSAGVGKSRLLRAALEHLAGGCPVLQLHAEPYGTASPYRVFRDPIRSLLGIKPGNAAASREQLKTGVARADRTLLPYLALLGEVVNIDIDPSPEVAAIEPRFKPDRIADTVIALLDSARPGRQVLVMEDAQWADGASARLLERLAAACAARAWLMLIARRDDAGGFDASRGQRIALEALPAVDLAALVNQATVSTPLRPHELDQVVRRASGNPLFALEIVRAAREVGSFEAVPDSLEAAIAARVDALDPDARRALRYATVLGRSFSRRMLTELLNSEGVDHGAPLLAQLDGFLAAEGDDSLQFRSGLLRKTVYEGLAFRLRVRLHRKAGEAMERLTSDPSVKADSLAVHFSAAGDRERTWHYARLAADRAARAYANADAARLYGMAIEAARRLPDIGDAERMRVWTDRGHVCRLAGLFDDARHAYQEAYKLTGDDPVGRAELLRLRALARERAGAFTQALHSLSSGTRLLADVHTLEARRERARLAAQAAMIRVGQERYEAAIEQGMAAAAAARRAGEKEALAQALVAAGSAQLSLGGDATEKMLEALQIYEELGDLSSEAMVRGNIGAGALIAGRWDEALTWFEGAYTAELRAGNHVGAACVASNRGEIYAKQGRLDEAEPVLCEAVRIMRASEFHEGAAYAEMQLGRVLLGRGATRQADALLERVGSELSRLGRKSSALEAALVRSRAKVGLGQAAAALELIDRAVAKAGGASGWLAPQAAEARAQSLIALGRLDEAEAQVNDGLATARELDLRYEEGTLLRTRAAVLRAAGHATDTSDLEESAAILGALGVRSTPSAL